jgi:stalled ribosome rescue protein Dom34
LDTVIIAGPGFTKDDIKKFADDAGLLKKSTKKIIYESASTAERSGIYELIKSEKVAGLLAKERIRSEFKLMEDFLNGLGAGKSRSGADSVNEAIDSYEASIVLVNDSVLSDPGVQGVLANAEKNKVRIEVFNSTDEAGQQLHAFKDIACIG